MSSNGGRAWRALVGLLRSQKRHMAQTYGELELTGALAYALTVVPREGITMRGIADELACDASNATGTVDRLEKRGLAERRPDPQDRRVKRVFLTTSGRRMRERLEARFMEPPPAIAALSAADQKTLREILERALAHAEAERLREEA